MTTPAQDLTALADKLDELAMKATADTWYIVGYDDSHCLVDSDDDEHPIAETAEYRNAKLICELRNALPQITTALREAARLREVEAERDRMRVGERERALAVALRRLAYWAQTSGGTEGRDEGLVTAINVAVEALMVHDTARATQASEPAETIAPAPVGGAEDALKSCEAWLSNWAQHVAYCRGGARCTCGLEAMRHEARAALKQEESRG